MQVKRNDNLRAEQVNRIEPLPVLSQNAEGLKNGDFFIAVVAQNEGDTVLLRAADGRLLRAVLQGETRLAQGDMVETVVTRSGGKSFLHILNISRAGAGADSGGAESMISQQTLSDMLSVLKRNPDMGINMALFLAENNIADTAENIAALTQLSRGEGIGALLGQILGMIDEAGQPTETAQNTAGNTAEVMHSAVRTPEAAAQTDGSAAQTPGAAAQTDGSAAQTPGAAAQTDGSAAQTPEAAAQTDGGAAQAGVQEEGDAAQGTHLQGTATQTEAQHDRYRAENTDAQMNKQAVQIQRPAMHTSEPSIPVNGDNAEPVLSAEAAVGDAVQKESGLERPDARIGKMIQEIFLRPEEQMGTEMKKTAAEMPWVLKMLKSELIQTDIKNKELCLKSVQQAYKQVEVAENVMRFEHMQIPVAARDGEYRTAELYVFRRQGGHKSADETGVCILVALDTQHIGRVEAMVREADGGILLEFRLEQPDRAEGFKRNSASLVQAIEAAGYRLKGIRFAGLEKRTTVLNAGEAIMPDAGEVPAGIDVKI